MYLHVIILAVSVLNLCVLPLAMPSALASIKKAEECTIPLPDPAQLSEEEKEWFTTFQEGTFYTQGWQEITTEILEKIPQESEKETLRESLDRLGIRIGCEWSKDNEVRKINTDMLETWGSLLQEVAEKDPKELPVVIADIQQKVFELVE